MTELANDPSLRAGGMIAEAQHKERSPYLTGASPIKLSDMKVEITGSPQLAEHTDEVLAALVSAPSGSGRCIRPRRFEPTPAQNSSKTAPSGAAFLFPGSSAGRPSGLADHKPPT